MLTNKTIIFVESLEVVIMETKLVKVESMLNYFILTYSDESVKYLRAHLSSDMVDAFKKGGSKKVLLSAAYSPMIGNEVVINEDGSFTSNGKDVYSVGEIAEDAKDSENEVFAETVD